MASIPGAFGTGHDELRGGTTAVFSQTQNTHEVDEAGGKVQPAAEFTGGIVIWKGVVVVMKTFTWKKNYYLY